MGVAGLWDVLRPAGQTRSLSHLALQDGFNRPDPQPSSSATPLRGFRIGIDASIWFFHAAYGREGENPELRTLFFRCARLMHTPFLPLFVFDGPNRPNVKRGKRIGKDAHWMVNGMKNIIEAFGYEWRTAPGEAEAELAYLNRIGVVDGILSDDVDNFIFGATLVIRNPSATLTGNSAHPLPTTNHTTIYALSTIQTHPSISLTRGGLILIGLLSGGDYHKGLDGCGMKVAVGLAKCGFGDQLLEACSRLSNEDQREELEEWLEDWRALMAEELRTNSRGNLPTKRAALSKMLLSSRGKDFPDLEVLLYYTTPVTSETDRRSARNQIVITWDREPDLGKIAALCETYFEWGWKARIVKRFRTVLWTGALCRILRRAVVEADRRTHGNVVSTVPSTPQKNRTRKDSECGTPSKMIARNFSSMSVSSPVRPSADEKQAGEALITKIHSSRKHLTTDKLLEYRLEIAPAQLVRLVEGGIKGTRLPPEKDDVYSDEEEDDDDDDDDDEGGKKKGKKGTGVPVNPDSHMRVWMPACMVELVEPGLVEEFKEVVREREEKKAGKGKGRKKKAVVDEGAKEKRKKKTPTKVKRTKAQNAYVDVSDDSMDSDNIRNNLKSHFMVTKTKASFPLAKAPSSTIPAPTASGSQPKARSKPKPISNVPLYALSDPDSLSESESASAPEFPRLSPKVKTKSAPAIIRISDILSPSKAKLVSAPLGERIQPAPFPMSLDNNCNINFGDLIVDHDDPFVEVDTHKKWSASPPKKSRKKTALSSDSESHEVQTKKSPRKSRKQTSPKHTVPLSDHKDRGSKSEQAPRPGSPSPMRLNFKSQMKPKPAIKSANYKASVVGKVHFKEDDAIIEISSGEDAPPPSKPMRAPLLVARAKAAQSLKPRPVLKAKTQSTLATSNTNARAFEDDIIDLT